jgi:hypothetical protein
VDTVGRTTAIAVISGVPRYWGVWLRFNFVRMRLMRRVRGPSRIDKNLRKLSFIHFAHWAVFDRVPPGAEGARRLPYPYLLFQSNFNGGAEEYIEAFSIAVRIGMRALWGRAYHVPPPVPVKPFADYIVENKIPTPYYYAAYPEASTTEVRKALELREKHEEFMRRSAELGPERFASEYDRFLTRVQRLL